MKPETFVCIVPSPTIPLGSIAVKSSTMRKGYDVMHEGTDIEVYLNWYQVEQNPECWRKVEDKYPCRICNVTFCYHNSPPEEREKTYEEKTAEYLASVNPVSYLDVLAEQKRQESMAKRFEFVPANRERYYSWHHGGKTVQWHEHGIGLPCMLAEWHIGNVHPTKEAAEQWGKEYAQYFQIPHQE